MELDGRVAVVTGAASGIGLALTEACLAAGMRVVMADIEEPVLRAEATRLRDAGHDVLDVVCDVSDPAQIEALRDRAVEAYGTVHLLCNNAGVASGQRNIDTPYEAYQWQVGINLLGPAYGVRAFAPLMVAQGEGHIVNTASEAGLTATPLLGAYHTTKYGVVGLSESLALELAGTGVGVTCLCPELVDTKIFDSTRNAPPGLDVPAPMHVPMSVIAGYMHTTAISPSEVADKVLDAVRADRFWVLTHEATHGRVRSRNEDLQEGRNPRPLTY